MMLGINAVFQDHFSESKVLQKQWAYLIDDNHRQQLELELQEIEIQEFRIEVAKVLPQFGNAPEDYAGRQLASVVSGATNTKLSQSFSKMLLKSAKKDYAAKKYEAANKKFAKFIDKYPHSARIPEVYLMLIEMEYAMTNYEKSIEYISHLVSSYPANEVTGYAMFVLGDIMQKQERYEDASDLYRTIQEAFPLAQIKKRARKELRSIGLE